MKRWKSWTLNLLLVLASCLIAIALCDFLVSRFASQVTSYRLLPRARYTFSSDSFTFSVSLNSAGFRDRDFPAEKHPGDPRRVVFLGDSMVFGWGVEEPDCFVRQVESLLRQADGDTAWEVFNLGIEGTAPPDYRDALLSLGGKLRPDMIIVCYYAGNDAIVARPEPRQILSTESSSGALSKFYPNHLLSFLGMVLRTRQKPPAYAMPGTYVENPLCQYLESTDPHIRERVASIDPDMLERALAWRVNPYIVAGSIEEPDLLRCANRNNNALIGNAASAQVFDEIREEAKRLGADIQLVIIPAGYNVTQEMWPGLRRMGYRTPPSLQGERCFQDTLLALAAKRNVHALDLLPYFQNDGDGLYCTLDPHFTIRGNTRTAELISEWLRGTLPPPSGRTQARRAELGEVSKEWSFVEGGDLGSWRIEGPAKTVQQAESCVRIEVSGPEVQMTTTSYLLDTSRCNRLLVRMRSTGGDCGKLYWGRLPDDMTQAYPFSDSRVILWPLAQDGEWHEYIIALEHGVSDWSGQWSCIRIDPASLAAGAENEQARTIEIDRIALGFDAPLSQAPNLWQFR